MNLNEFQEKAIQYRISPLTPIYDALGLCGEAGEIADALKKYWRNAYKEDGTQESLKIDVEHIKEEIGDVLWYLAVLAEDLGITLDEAATTNILKCEYRRQTGTTKVHD